MPNIYIALLHHPVMNKNGDVIESAITNLDLHDISRAAKTYGVKGYYVATRLVDQVKLARRIIGHWTNGAGADYNPARRSALELIRIAESLEDIVQHIAGQENVQPKTVATCARKFDDAVNYHKMRELMGDGKPYLLVFGTAWGLAQETIRQADYTLEPIAGQTGYNHLSVRSAASIILDRLIGR